MELTQSLRFRLVQVHLLLPAEAGGRRSPVFAESWEWFRRRYRSHIAQAAKRLSWLDRDDREPELWVYLIPHLTELKYEARRGSLDGYIAVVISRAASDAARAARKRLREPSAEELPENLCCPGGDPQAGLDEQDLRRVVRESIEALRRAGADEDARLLERHWFEGVSLAAIAAELGLPSAQVRYQHGQACAKLRTIRLRGPWRQFVRELAGDLAPRQEKPDF